MNKTSQRIWISLAVLLVIACMCASVLGLGGIGYSMFAVRRNTSSTAAPTLVYSLTPTHTPASPDAASATPKVTRPSPTPTTCPAAGCPTLTPTIALPPGVAEQLTQIQAQVESLRGLHARNPVPLILLSQEQLQKRVATDFLADYTTADAEKDGFIMSTFGFIPAGYDLMALYNAMYSEKVAGYYDPKTKQMFVVQDGSFGGNEKIGYAHEFTHVLQDQNYDLRSGLGFEEEHCKTESERCAALLSLIEGDASEIEQLWLVRYASEQDKSDIYQAYQNMSSPVFDAAPDVIKEDLYFPYRTGYEFVMSLLDKGGQAAVDAAYTNPPVSTEQIMHPERYPNDKPVAVSLPDLLPALGQGWTKLDQDVMGEFYTYLLLAKGSDTAARLSETTARTAAEGWGGDAYAIYRSAQNQAALVLDSRWDTSKDAGEFADAFGRYAASRWGSAVSDGQGVTTTWQNDQDFVIFNHTDQRTLWIQAPDEATARALLAALKLSNR
jgi:hypothetical protein